MKAGEACLETNDVIRLAAFYKQLLNIHDDQTDSVHQTLIAEETMLTIYNDGSQKENNSRNISLVFTVDDIDHYYTQLVDRGISIIEGPIKRPWGTIIMSFHDPDGNVIYLRQFS